MLIHDLPFGNWRHWKGNPWLSQAEFTVYSCNESILVNERWTQTSSSPGAECESVQTLYCHGKAAHRNTSNPSLQHLWVRGDRQHDYHKGIVVCNLFRQTLAQLGFPKRSCLFYSYGPNSNSVFRRCQCSKLPSYNELSVVFASCFLARIPTASGLRVGHQYKRSALVK